jgi:hypothetical protein
MIDIKNCFDIKKDVRNDFIEKNIVAKLPEKVRESARQKAKKIADNYVGRDLDALSVLAYSAERERFEEFVEKLELHYKESLQYVHPEARRIAEIPGVIRAETFFLNCYKGMGIKSQNN